MAFQNKHDNFQFQQWGCPSPFIEDAEATAAWALDDFLHFLGTWTKGKAFSPSLKTLDLLCWLQDHFGIPAEITFSRGTRRRYDVGFDLGCVPVPRRGGFTYLVRFSQDQLDAAFQAWSKSDAQRRESESLVEVDEPWHAVDSGSVAALGWDVTDCALDDVDF